MSQQFVSGNSRITLEKSGSTSYPKMSYPIHCGRYSEIETENFVFHFNLNKEIIRAKGKGGEWAHPHEWLKRTQGNDWIYYSTGGYTGVFEATGEYYLPNFQYPTNSILGGHPFTQGEVNHLTDSWHQMLGDLRTQMAQVPDTIDRFLADALANTPQLLEQKAEKLRQAVGGRISVLPPDARHVDYNLIPLIISRGCLYKCKFCKVKNDTAFVEKTRDEIRNQLGRLKQLYSRDLPNYNSLFLGEHDALLTSSDLMYFSIDEAFRELGLGNSYLEGSNVFLFGSVASLLQASDRFFEKLAELPAMVYINIGLESADQETLDRIGKPITEKQVREAFHRGQEINDRHSSIEITANFIMDEQLPENHYRKIVELIRDKQPRVKPKGAIYFSPLTFDQPSRARLFEFNRLKVLSRLPTYLYIIQRL